MFDEEHVIYRYKYLPFTDGSLKTISEGTIKFACPLEFNDPFDCLPYYDTSRIDKVPRMRPDLFKAAGDRRGLSPAKRLMQKPLFIARLKAQIEDGSFARNLMRNVGVVSLSKNALNIPMWSHYADFHRGFVLEFRIPKMGKRKDLFLVTNRLTPFPIVYTRDRPKIMIGTEYPDDLVKKLVLTKSDDWDYEEEERVIDQERSPGIHPYRRDDILSSVIAGLRMDANNYQRLESLVKVVSNKNIPSLKLFRAHEVKGLYKLAVYDHPRLSSI